MSIFSVLNRTDLPFYAQLIIVSVLVPGIVLKKLQNFKMHYLQFYSRSHLDLFG